MLTVILAAIGVLLLLLAYGIRAHQSDAQIIGAIGVMSLLAVITPMAGLMMYAVGAFCLARGAFSGGSPFRSLYLILGVVFLSPVILLMGVGSMIALSR